MLKAIKKDDDETVAVKMVAKADLDGEDIKNIFTELKITSNV